VYKFYKLLFLSFRSLNCGPGSVFGIATAYGQKRVQSFNLYFLPNSPLVQINISASECEGVGNIPGSHFMKTFSALPLYP
jgi:hypothetical protein